jgi:hypothetical protein
MLHCRYRNRLESMWLASVTQFEMELMAQRGTGEHV